MKLGYIFAVIVVSLMISMNFLNAQDITGHWKGNLDVNGKTIPLVFKLNAQADGKITGSLDSPSQGAMDLKIDEIEVKALQIKMTMNAFLAKYEGKFENGEKLIKGKFTQGGIEFPLDLIKSEKIEEVKRTQLPKEPFSYKSIEVSFINEEEKGVKLAGTLTIPNGSGPFPAVVLVSGSGQQDRDETVFNHKPFLVLADHLTRNGIAVLRYDDRGVGGSTGEVLNATTVNFAMDANAAVNHLLNNNLIDNSKIGIIGHSEGGIIAPMLAQQSDEVSFIIMLAGPGISGKEIIFQQTKMILETEKVDENLLNKYMGALDKILNHLITVNEKDKKTELMNKEIADFMNGLDEREKEILKKNNMQLEGRLQMLLLPWVDFFLKHDPADDLENVLCPVLALLGEKDVQVPSKTNLQPIKNALEKAGNKDFEVLEMKSMNHMFQECKTGAMSEYYYISHTISPKVLEIVTNWIKDKTGK